MIPVAGVSDQARPGVGTGGYDSNPDPATGLTAMMRCTAFPVSIVAQMLADGTIERRGVPGLEDVVPTGRFIEELARRNIEVHQRTEAAVS